MIHHPTSTCFVLEDKIQAWVDTGILTLKSEQKKVTVNMVTFNFGTFLKVTIQSRVAPIPKVRMEVINRLAKEQEAKGLVPLTTKSGEIIWVHPNIIKNEQWESSQLKLKGKFCNVISLAVDDDIVTTASLSSSEEEKFTFAAAMGKFLRNQFTHQNNIVGIIKS